ncbi:DUF4389 domain-containing protein [Rubellimicrobium rubrum]|uniref:DUF4389 domain-containing protein n=1 Tax=Rubellimicrobium rubrum TaxID=2585369 RepID=A0A5C4MUH2_9RHOB|nr:DUF4389 domain-containing protein [Rubellimicrobium rubrum]TNC48027.1 DUF4389 domain-containing protein [Rubellimicrobium rubrum]
MSDADLSSTRSVESPENRAREPGQQPLSEGLGYQLLYTILIAVLFSLLQTVLSVLMVLQFVLLLVSRRQPNPRIAELGRSLGRWCDRAARYVTADTEEKPWPWRPFD